MLKAGASPQALTLTVVAQTHILWPTLTTLALTKPLNPCWPHTFIATIRHLGGRRADIPCGSGKA